jgi:hypothetical protein
VNQAKLDAVTRRLNALRADEASYRAEIQATGESMLQTRKQLLDLTQRETNLQRDLPKLTQQTSDAATQRARILGIDTQRRQADLSAATAVPSTAADQLLAADIVNSARSAPGATLDAAIAELIARDIRSQTGVSEAVLALLNRLFSNAQVDREDYFRRLNNLEAAINQKLTYQQ